MRAGHLLDRPAALPAWLQSPLPYSSAKIITIIILLLKERVGSGKGAQRTVRNVALILFPEPRCS